MHAAAKSGCRVRSHPERELIVVGIGDIKSRMP